jgi:hypothetical protein
MRHNVVVFTKHSKIVCITSLHRLTTELLANHEEHAELVPANIHRSLDGKKVVNYAQWESTAAFEAISKNPNAIPHMQAAAVLVHFEPILCEISKAISLR